MSSKRTVTARFYRRNSEEIVLQTKKYDFLTVLALIIVFPIGLIAFARGYRGRWVDTAVMNSMIYSLDEDLNSLVLEALEIYKEREAREEILKGYSEFISNSKEERLGYSRPCQIEESLVRSVNMMQKVDQSWKKHLSFGSKKPTTPRGKLRDNFRDTGEDRFGKDISGANKAVFIDEQFKNLHYTLQDFIPETLGADEIVYTRKEKNKQNNGGRASRKKRNDLNETDRSHQKRLKLLQENPDYDFSGWDYEQ